MLSVDRSYGREQFEGTKLGRRRELCRGLAVASQRNGSVGIHAGVERWPQVRPSILLVQVRRRVAL